MNEITNSVAVNHDIRWISFNELAFYGVDHVLKSLNEPNVVKLTGWRKRKNVNQFRAENNMFRKLFGDRSSKFEIKKAVNKINSF